MSKLWWFIFSAILLSLNLVLGVNNIINESAINAAMNFAAFGFLLGAMIFIGGNND